MGDASNRHNETEGEARDRGDSLIQKILSSSTEVTEDDVLASFQSMSGRLVGTVSAYRTLVQERNKNLGNSAEELEDVSPEEYPSPEFYIFGGKESVPPGEVEPQYVFQPELIKKLQGTTNHHGILYRKTLANLSTRSRIDPRPVDHRAVGSRD